ncbi:UNVERIFIED_CONTAM: hypothetical protein FKN15_002049 [Acipenser sinensis]
MAKENTIVRLQPKPNQGCRRGRQSSNNRLSVMAVTRSALLDALDAPTVLVEKERENQRGGRSDLRERERERQGERGTIGQAPEYCIGKQSAAGRAGRRSGPCG